MLEELPDDVIANLKSARGQKRFARKRFRLHSSGNVFAIEALRSDTLIIKAEPGTQIRGNVDVYEAGRHILTCLIVASQFEEGRLHCSFKRATLVRDRAPEDFPRDQEALAGYLAHDHGV